MINIFIKEHKLSKVAHKEILSMTHSDNEVADLFHKSEMEMTNRVTEFLLSSGFKSDNISEKVHVAIGMIDNLCHEVVYHKHKQLNYDKMIDIVISNISNMLK